MPLCSFLQLVGVSKNVKTDITLSWRDWPVVIGHAADVLEELLLMSSTDAFLRHFQAVSLCKACLLLWLVPYRQ